MNPDKSIISEQPEIKELDNTISEEKEKFQQTVAATKDETVAATKDETVAATNPEALGGSSFKSKKRRSKKRKSKKVRKTRRGRR